MKSKTNLRRNFGKEEHNIPKLDLTSVQRESWQWFLEKGIIEELKNIIAKYREAGLLVPNSSKSTILVGLCACEIDESLNFDPENQIIINYVSSAFESIIKLDEEDKSKKSIQMYIATERSFARNS